MRFNTVDIEFTNPEDNITDLMNLVAICAFQAGFTESEIKEYANVVIEDQYEQCIMSLPIYDAP